MSEYYDTKVPIRDELKKELIFGIKARPPIGIVLGFYGFRYDVMELMKHLSHGTRAYIINADGLPGFLLKGFDVERLLK